MIGGGHLRQGISDSLPYDNHTFDIVVLGFCLYQVPRLYLSDSLHEADRVLKDGGFLAITDFDTPISFVRENIHNPDMPVYKCDYSKYYTNNGYTLIEKHSYDSMGQGVFNLDIQERESTQILYKEKVGDVYIVG